MHVHNRPHKKRTTGTRSLSSDMPLEHRTIVLFKYSWHCTCSRSAIIWVTSHNSQHLNVSMPAASPTIEHYLGEFMLYKYIIVTTLQGTWYSTVLIIVESSGESRYKYLYWYCNFKTLIERTVLY